MRDTLKTSGEIDGDLKGLRHRRKPITAAKSYRERTALLLEMKKAVEAARQSKAAKDAVEAIAKALDAVFTESGAASSHLDGQLAGRTAKSSQSNGPVKKPRRQVCEPHKSFLDF